MAINVMLIGLGNISMHYDLHQENIISTHLKALMNDERFKIHTGVDINVENQIIFKEITGGLIFSNLEIALSEVAAEIDVFVIATPTDLHYEQYKIIRSIIKSDLNKIILLEKPITDDIKSLEKIIYDYKIGNKIFVNLFRLYQKNLNEVLEVLSNYGRCTITVTYSKGILHNGIHFFTLITRYFGRCLSWKKISDINIVAHEFEFPGADVVFKKSHNDCDDNSMIVNSDFGSLYYLYGGRHGFYIDEKLNKTDLDIKEFNHYQKFVYENLYKCMNEKNGLLDSSFELAVEAQRVLHEVEINL